MTPPISIKKQRRKREMMIGLVLVMANLMLLNVLSNSHFSRWDLTEDKIYTLNDDTRKILETMDDVVTVKYFITRDLPPGWLEIREKTENLLNEFKVIAGDNMQLVFLDPTEDKKARIEAEQYGITEFPMQQYGSESYEVRTGFMGVLVRYENRFLSIHPADPETLEYELLMRIVRILDQDTPTVAFYETRALPDNLSPELEAQMKSKVRKKNRHRLGRDYRAVHADLKKLYNVETADLNDPVPDHVNTLVIANPDSMDDKALYYADQFLMRGGKLVLLVQGVHVNINQGAGAPADDYLDHWLAHYGIVVEKNLVMDTQCAKAQFNTNRGGFNAPVQKDFYPLLRVTEEDINQEHVISRGIKDMTLPFFSSIRLKPDLGARDTVLIKSSSTSWALEDMFNLNPELLKPAPEDQRESYDLAGVLEGEFISFYAGREAPPDVEDKNLLLRSKGSVILVFGSNDFLKFNWSNPTVRRLFSNAVDYVTVGKNFGEIRARQTKTRYIAPEYINNMGAKNFFKIMGVLSGALGVVLIGLILYLMRKTESQSEVRL